MLRRHLLSSILGCLVLLGPAQAAFAQREAPPQPVLVLSESFQRPPDARGQTPVDQSAVTSPGVELHVYGRDAGNLTISGAATGNTPINLWTGLSEEPIAVTLRDRDNFLDLSGLARMSWQTRASGFHAVHPIVHLADGRWLIADRAETNTSTFLHTEFTFTGLRWIELDIDRVVTTGSYGPFGEADVFVEPPDLSRVDEIGFADLMPGTGHGAGGWVNVGDIEIYGQKVPR